MKLTSLFKKAATVLCALALVGMLAACSNGSSSSSDNNGSGNGSGSAKKGEYKLMYDDILIMDGGTEEDASEMLSMFTEGTDYTITGKTMTLTNAGFTKFLVEMSEDKDDPYTAIIVYKKEMLGPVTASELALLSLMGFSTPADYTLTHNGKVIDLTDAGYAKAKAMKD